jgi:hypothetical protein
MESLSITNHCRDVTLAVMTSSCFLLAPNRGWPKLRLDVSSNGRRPAVSAVGRFLFRFAESFLIGVRADTFAFSFCRARASPSPNAANLSPGDSNSQVLHTLRLTDVFLLLEY